LIKKKKKKKKKIQSVKFNCEKRMVYAKVLFICARRLLPIENTKV